MKRELNQGLLNRNGVNARIAMRVRWAILVEDMPETCIYDIHGPKVYWRLNFCMHEDSTASIVKNLNINYN